MPKLTRAAIRARRCRRCKDRVAGIEGDSGGRGTGEESIAPIIPQACNDNDKMTDEEFLYAFEGATLPRTEWTHEAHVRMGYLSLCRMPLPEAIGYARERILAYNRAQGNFTGYHETITIAFLHHIAKRMRDNDEGKWESFRVAHAELIARGMEILLQNYTRDALFSHEARSAFLAPDIAPLPEAS